jgi:hypothetical protein
MLQKFLEGEKLPEIGGELNRITGGDTRDEYDYQ